MQKVWIDMKVKICLSHCAALQSAGEGMCFRLIWTLKYLSSAVLSPRLMAWIYNKLLRSYFLLRSCLFKKWNSCCTVDCVWINSHILTLTSFTSGIKISLFEDIVKIAHKNEESCSKQRQRDAVWGGMPSLKNSAVLLCYLSCLSNLFPSLHWRTRSSSSVSVCVLRLTHTWLHLAWLGWLDLDSVFGAFLGYPT